MNTAPQSGSGTMTRGPGSNRGAAFPQRSAVGLFPWVPFGDINTREVQKRILGLVDLQAALLKETSLASFVSGFQLAHGITGELTSYCFARGEEDRAEEEIGRAHV